MNNGLEDVVAAETVLSDVRGAEGQLIIRGFPLSELAGQWTFEEAAHLLFSDFFDELPDATAFAARLGEARAEVFEVTRKEIGSLAELPGYDGMRAAMAMLPDGIALSDALRLLRLSLRGASLRLRRA